MRAHTYYCRLRVSVECGPVDLEVWLCAGRELDAVSEAVEARWLVQPLPPQVHRPADVIGCVGQTARTRLPVSCGALVIQSRGVTQQHVDRMEELLYVPIHPLL